MIRKTFNLIKDNSTNEIVLNNGGILTKYQMNKLQMNKLANDFANLLILNVN